MGSSNSGQKMRLHSAPPDQDDQKKRHRCLTCMRGASSRRNGRPRDFSYEPLPCQGEGSVLSIGQQTSAFCGRQPDQPRQLLDRIARTARTPDLVASPRLEGSRIEGQLAPRGVELTSGKQMSRLAHWTTLLPLLVELRHVVGYHGTSRSHVACCTDRQRVGQMHEHALSCAPGTLPGESIPGESRLPRIAAAIHGSILLLRPLSMLPPALMPGHATCWPLSSRSTFHPSHKTSCGRATDRSDIILCNGARRDNPHVAVRQRPSLRTQEKCTHVRVTEQD